MISLKEAKKYWGYYYSFCAKKINEGLKVIMVIGIKNPPSDIHRCYRSIGYDAKSDGVQIWHPTFGHIPKDL